MKTSCVFSRQDKTCLFEREPVQSVLKVMTPPSLEIHMGAGLMTFVAHCTCSPEFPYA